MENCKFCNEGNNIIPIRNQENILQRKIYEDDTFYVIVSVGALVEGHLLVIPKKHYLSAGEFEKNVMDQFLILKQKLIGILKKQYQKEVIAFEHGTGRFSKVSSASVIHAHVHLVPVDGSILPDIKKNASMVVMLDSMHDLKKCAESGKSYLFYQDVNGELYIVEKANAQSQFFRKLICDIYHYGEWDWHKDYSKNNMIKTVEKLQINPDLSRG